ncbi:MAG: thioredoxin [Rhodospirillales bacterium]
MAIISDPSAQPPAPGGGGAAEPAGAGGAVIKEGTEASFMADVIEASMAGPVIVDFWAPWCEPCKTLGPMLEKIVREAAGAVRMVKINIDENQQVAAQLRVQSIPTVYAFAQGQPVDAFQGALPESELRAFVKKLTGGQAAPVEAALEQAEAALAGDDAAGAAAVFQQVLAQDPENVRAAGGLIRAALAAGDTPGARAFADGLSDALKKTPEITQAVSALELAEQSGAHAADEAGLAAFAARIEAEPGDLQARFDYALALTGAGRSADAIDQLIEIVRRNRTWNDDAARAQLLKIFEALGFSDPAAQEGRKKLSSVLFS